MLLAGHGASAHRASFCGIALIGLRGAGKSTLGKLLAEKIGWNFVELNKEVEAQNGLSVAEIIALYGQEGFRRMEQTALNQLLARKDLMVLATGGGIVSEPLTFDLHPVVVLHDLAQGRAGRAHGARAPAGRSTPDGGRPLGDGGELRNILVSREPLYARASATVDTAGLSVDAAAARLIDTVRPVLQNEARLWAKDGGGISSLAGWAKRSVPTISTSAQKWWARRKRAFAHPTRPPSFRPARRMTDAVNCNCILSRFVENQIRIGRGDHTPQTAIARELAGVRMP